MDWRSTAWSGWPADAGKMEEMIRDFAGRTDSTRDLFGAPGIYREIAQW